MKTKSIAGAALEQALQDGSIERVRPMLHGMVKRSDKPGHISFSQAGCDRWVDVPSGMIDQAEHLGQAGCRDHTHPFMRISLKEPKEEEGRVLLDLLAQASASAVAGPAGAPVGMPLAEGMPGPEISSDMPAPAYAGGPGMAMSPAFRSSAAFGSFRGLGGFGGFGGFGGTLPTCRWVKRVVQCGSALPGYAVPMCETWIYCCTYPNGSESCM